MCFIENQNQKQKYSFEKIPTRMSAAVSSSSSNENDVNETISNDTTSSDLVSNSLIIADRNDATTNILPISVVHDSLQQVLGKRKRDWDIPILDHCDEENMVDKKYKTQLLQEEKKPNTSDCNIQFCTTRVAQLLRILECIQTVVEHADFHFTPNGFTVFESSKYSIAHINLVLNKAFFHNYHCNLSGSSKQSFLSREESVPLTTRMSIRGKCNTNELFTNVSILKKHHNAKAVVFDVSQKGTLACNKECQSESKIVFFFRYSDTRRQSTW